MIIRTSLTRSESTTIICRFYDLCFLRVLWFLRVLAYHATLSSPEKEKYIYPKTKKTILLFKQCGRLSFVFSPRLVEISYAISVFFFLLSFRVRVLEARHRGRARRRRGCQLMLAGRARVARSAIAVFAARRRACLETRGNNEWAPSGLHLKN